MPTIPKVADITRVNPTVGRPLAATPTGGKALGQAVQNVGFEIHEKQLRDRKNALVDADLEMAIALEKESRAYDQDEDYATIGERFEASTQEAMGTIASTITDEGDREDFKNRQRLAIERTRTQVGRVAWGKERDHNRGRIDTQLTSAREAALHGDMGEIAVLVQERLDSAVEKDYYSREEADAIYEKWRTSAAVGKLEMMEPENRLEALKQPWADNIPSDTRARLLRAAESEARIGQAQGIVDGLEDKGSTLNEGLLELRDIDDPRLRAEAEQRWKQSFTASEAAKQDARNALGDKYSLMLEQPGYTTDDIPRDDWEAMGRVMRENLKVAEANKIRPRTVSDPAVRERAQIYAARGDWKSLEALIATQGHLLTSGDQEQYTGALAKGVAPASANDPAIVMSVLPGNEYKEIRPVITGRLATWRNDYVQLQGKEPTQQDVEGAIRRMILDHDRGSDAWWKLWHSEVPIYTLTGQEQSDALHQAMMEDMREEDAETYDQTIQYMNTRGLNVENRFEVEDQFKAQRMVNGLDLMEPGIVDALSSNLEDAGVKAPTNEQILMEWNRLDQFRRRNQIEDIPNVP